MVLTFSTLYILLVYGVQLHCCMRLVSQWHGVSFCKHELSCKLQVPLASTHVLIVACMVQEAEPTLASHLHMTILAQKSLAKCMAFLLANKLSSPTLLGTQLTRLITDAYSDDEVSL